MEAKKMEEKIPEVVEKDIAILKEAIHTKLWRNVPEQQEKWMTLLRNLSANHNVPCPSLVIDNRIKIPEYNVPLARITLDKYSLISMLHEFGHHIKLEEDECVAYSEYVFITAYLPAKKYLVRDERGYLVKNIGGK